MPKIKKTMVTGVLFTAIVLSVTVSFLLAHEIILKNGKTIIVNDYWEREGKIAFQQFGTTVYLDKKEIEKIINENPSVVQQNSTDSEINNPESQQPVQEEEDTFLIELYNHALELYAQQKYEKAISYLSLCIDSDHNIANSYLHRGTALFQLAIKLKPDDKNRLDMGTYAKSDLDKAISFGESTGLAYINRARVKWLIVSDDVTTVQDDLNRVINDQFPLKGLAYYWKGILARSQNNSIEANKFMIQSAKLGYEDATQILYENPNWPNKFR